MQAYFTCICITNYRVLYAEAWGTIVEGNHLSQFDYVFVASLFSGESLMVKRKFSVLFTLKNNMGYLLFEYLCERKQWHKVLLTRYLTILCVNLVDYPAYGKCLTKRTYLGSAPR